MKKKTGKGLKLAIAAVVLALAAVAGVILWRNWQYTASEEFYEGLRAALQGGMQV